MLSYKFKSLADKTMYSYIIFLFAIFSPGFIFLYLTDNNLFHNADIIKLIILSTIYTIPLIFICLIGSVYGKNNLGENQESNIEITILDASLKTILSLYAFAYVYSLAIITEKFSAIELFYGIPVILTVFDLIDKNIHRFLYKIKKREKKETTHLFF